MKIVKAIRQRRLPKIFTPKSKLILHGLRGIFYPGLLYKALKNIEIVRKRCSTWPTYSEKDNEIWLKAFKKYLLRYPERLEIFKSFSDIELKCVKLENNNIKDNEVILLCVVKNDLERIKMVYSHHKKLGVKKFVILDNNSSDGTLEWICTKSDIDVYQTEEKFNSLRKYGWINKLISIYGMNRWYLYVDSDELFVYDNCENKDIHNLIDTMHEKKFYRMGVAMIDMYSERGIYKPVALNKKIDEELIYFDTNSYNVTEIYKGTSITGGPRERVLGKSERTSPLIVKHPLFYFNEGNIFESAHYLFPYKFNIPINGALLHYKFLESDFEKHKIIAKEGNFSMGSKEYKMYISSFSSNSDITFMYHGTARYNNSSSLREINIIKPLI